LPKSATTLIKLHALNIIKNADPQEQRKLDIFSIFFSFKSHSNRARTGISCSSKNQPTKP
jgi:hypothetical protein